MQTFLPYSRFFQSAQCLDKKRLGKQRLEARQIINTLEGRSKGWKNHPAVLMWGGYEEALKLYFNIISKVWVLNGYKHTMGWYTISVRDLLKPVWLGNEKLHASHRSNLLRKNPDWYSQFNWTEDTTTSYFWPVQRNT